jgi:hypothetical protein
MVLYKKGELVYSPIIEGNLSKLIQMGVDLKEVLYNSEILMIQITHKSYPPMHALTDSKIFPAKNHSSIQDVIIGGNEILEEEYRDISK